MCLTQPTAPDIHKFVVDRKRYRLRLADTEDHRNAAIMLINERYSWRGYDTSFHFGKSPNLVTLIASDDAKMIGTVSLGIAHETGLLLADELYKEEIAALRLASCKLCEVTQFACDGIFKPRSVLASLFHISIIYGFQVHGCTDLLIEVNPRHAAFYKAMLGFKEYGPQKLCTRVKAPAVLLRLELSYADRMIKEFAGAGRQAASEKSLYPHFFSKAEEMGITNRLRQCSQPLLSQRTPVCSELQAAA